MKQMRFDSAAAIVVSRQLIWLLAYLRNAKHVRVGPELLSQLRQDATLACELVHDTFTDEVS